MSYYKVTFFNDEKKVLLNIPLKNILYSKLIKKELKKKYISLTKSSLLNDANTTNKVEIYCPLDMSDLKLVQLMFNDIYNEDDFILLCQDELKNLRKIILFLQFDLYKIPINILEIINNNKNLINTIVTNYPQFENIYPCDRCDEEDAGSCGYGCDYFDHFLIMKNKFGFSLLLNSKGLSTKKLKLLKKMSKIKKFNQLPFTDKYFEIAKDYDYSVSFVDEWFYVTLIRSSKIELINIFNKDKIMIKNIPNYTKDFYYYFHDNLRFLFESNKKKCVQSLIDLDTGKHYQLNDNLIPKYICQVSNNIFNFIFLTVQKKDEYGRKIKNADIVTFQINTDNQTIILLNKISDILHEIYYLKKRNKLIKIDISGNFYYGDNKKEFYKNDYYNYIISDIDENFLFVVYNYNFGRNSSYVDIIDLDTYKYVTKYFDSEIICIFLQNDKITTIYNKIEMNISK